MLFPREIGLRRSLCTNRSDFNRYISSVNGKSSCYTSLYFYEKADPRRSWRADTESVVIDKAWWDFDITDDTTFDDVRSDVGELVNRLEGDIRIVATGRGFHVYQFFDRPVHGTGMVKHLDRYQREISKGLKTLDGVGNPSKLTRIPDTYNPKRGRWAVNIDPVLFRQDPMGYAIPKQPIPSLSKHDPFRGSEPNGTFSLVKWAASNPLPVLPVLTAFEGDIGGSGDIPLPPCLERAIHEENPRHFTRIFLATHLAENLRWFANPESLTTEQIEQMTSEILSFISKLGWRDFNEGVSRKHIKSVIGYDNTPTCAKIQSNGLCMGSCWRDDGTLR
jgi:hypothetical protein